MKKYFIDLDKAPSYGIILLVALFPFFLSEQYISSNAFCQSIISYMSWIPGINKIAILSNSFQLTIFQLSIVWIVMPFVLLNFLYIGLLKRKDAQTLIKKPILFLILTTYVAMEIGFFKLLNFELWSFFWGEGGYIDETSKFYLLLHTKYGLSLITIFWGLGLPLFVSLWIKTIYAFKKNLGVNK